MSILFKANSFAARAGGNAAGRPAQVRAATSGARMRVHRGAGWCIGARTACTLPPAGHSGRRNRGRSTVPASGTPGHTRAQNARGAATDGGRPGGSVHAEDHGDTKGHGRRPCDVPPGRVPTGPQDSTGTRPGAQRCSAASRKRTSHPAGPCGRVAGVRRPGRLSRPVWLPCCRRSRRAAPSGAGASRSAHAAHAAWCRSCPANCGSGWA